MSVDRKTLLALAERCENAEGPDRRLDADIARAARWEHRALVAWWYPPGSKTAQALPHFTASFDAARTICRWILISASDIGADGMARVVLGNPTPPSPMEACGISYGGGKHALALAYCAAALRACAEELEP